MQGLNDFKSLILKEEDLQSLLSLSPVPALSRQRLAALVDLDVPWNSSRLEQSKGRIQRIGQIHSEIDDYNMRHTNSCWSVSGKSPFASASGRRLWEIAGAKWL